MTTAAKIGHGTLFQRGDSASPEVFTTVAEVINISGPTRAFDIIDATSQESAGATREFIAGLIDPGEYTIELGFIPGNTTHTDVRNDHINRTNRNYRITHPDSPVSTETFACFVSGFELNAPIGELRTATITVKVTGTTTIA